MLQDIHPHTYNNDFALEDPRLQDFALVYDGTAVLAHIDGAQVSAPTFQDFGLDVQDEDLRAVYLYSIDDQRYFLVEASEDEIRSLLDQSGWEFIELSDLVECEPKHVRFGLSLGYEYRSWYESSQYCGRCATPLEHDALERMMHCPECGLMVFPKLFPAVIVGITRPDGKVLVSRYLNRPPKRYALIAGYCEMGETVEQTVHREVAEEVGLRVKNLRYFNSQPWPLSSSLLFGFFAELDGSPDIHLDVQELEEALWIDRDELPEDNDHSLTRCMMGVMREGRETEYPLVKEG